MYLTAFLFHSFFKQGMFAIVHSFVLLRDSHNILYFMSLSFIPLTLMYAGLGYYAVSITWCQQWKFKMWKKKWCQFCGSTIDSSLPSHKLSIFLHFVELSGMHSKNCLLSSLRWYHVDYLHLEEQFEITAPNWMIRPKFLVIIIYRFSIAEFLNIKAKVISLWPITRMHTIH